MNESLHESLAGGVTDGVVDWSGERCRLRLAGADRVAFLQGQCTNDVKNLRPGESCYAAFLTAKGKMRGEGHILCLADAYLLETSPGLQPSLEKFIITEDVTVEDVTASLGEWLVVGAAVALPPGAMTFRHPLGIGVMAAAAALPATLSAGQWEVLRVESALARWGVDLGEDTIPVEAGLAKRAISYDKGCYIGQETIARIQTYGHVNRQLVQMAVSGTEVPVRGATIRSADREVGQITSAVRSVRWGRPVALGYVRRELAGNGNKVQIGQTEAEVTAICGEK